MRVINEAKKGAAKDSMYSYVKAVELAATKDLQPDSDLISGTYITKDGNIYRGSTKILEIDLKGTKPTNNTGNIILNKGQVKSADLKFDDYCTGYDGKEALTKDACPIIPPVKTYTVGVEVYYDPTGVVTDCIAGKEWTPSNTKTTCYKWNVIRDNGSDVEMLLNHNTTDKLAWNSCNDNTTGPKEVYSKLKTDTESWSGVETLTNYDNVIRDNGNGSTYTINYSGMKARIITAQEIANIGKDTVWATTKYTGTKYTKSPWLYQNLSITSEMKLPTGYWTDTAVSLHSFSAWNMYYDGELGNVSVKSTISGGVRPVVRVLKSNI